MGGICIGLALTSGYCVLSVVWVDAPVIGEDPIIKTHRGKKADNLHCYNLSEILIGGHIYEIGNWVEKSQSYCINMPGLQVAKELAVRERFGEPLAV